VGGEGKFKNPTRKHGAWGTRKKRKQKQKPREIPHPERRVRDDEQEQRQMQVQEPHAQLQRVGHPDPGAYERWAACRLLRTQAGVPVLHVDRDASGLPRGLVF